MLEHRSIDPRQVVTLLPWAEETRVSPLTADDIALVTAGYTVAEAIAGKAPVMQFDQLSLL